jgi:hypothetical protein
MPKTKVNPQRKHSTSATELPLKPTIPLSLEPEEVKLNAQPLNGKFNKGDRVQVICPPGWVELAYAATGSRGTVQRMGKNRLSKNVFVLLDSPPAPGKRCDVCLHLERVSKVLETGWNETAEGRAFWERVALVWPFLLPEETDTGYFDPALDYPRSLHWLEQLEARRQFKLPLEPVDKHTSTQAQSPDLPLEPTPDEQIAALRREGAVAPEGYWIETGKVKGNFRQAWYRSRSPCFPPIKGSLPVKTQYLGVAGGDKHKEAIKAIERRNRIKKLKKQLEKNNGRPE